MPNSIQSFWPIIWSNLGQYVSVKVPLKMVFDGFDEEFETCSGRRCHIGFVAVVKVYSLIAKFRGIGFFLVDDFLVPKSLPNCDPKITWLVMKKKIPTKCPIITSLPKQMVRKSIRL